MKQESKVSDTIIRIEENLQEFLYFRDQPPADKVIIPRESIVRNPDERDEYFANAVYVVNCPTEKTHRVSLGFKVDNNLKIVESSLRYV